MGIFDRIKQQRETDTNSTKGFYLGSPEAEAENKTDGLQNLEHYFEDYLGILPQISNGKFLIIGRKGTGKSAIATYIKETSSKEDDSYCDLIRVPNIDLERLVHLASKSSLVNNSEETLFEWLILVRLTKLLLKNPEGVHIQEYKKLKTFLERNSGFVDIDKYQIEEAIEKKGGEISFGVLKHSSVFNAVLSRYFDARVVQAPYYKLINPLKEILSTVINYDVHKSKEYILLFDDLDIYFKESKQNDIDTIVQLVRVAKYYNTELFKGTKSKVIVFLRDDIKNIVLNRYADTAKIFSSYEVELNWYHNEYDEDLINLKKFINRRIELNFKANARQFNQADPWSSLVDNNSFLYGDKTAFKYILDCTFYRPRDLILFFNEIGNSNETYPLTHNAIMSMLHKLAEKLIGESRNELSIIFDPEEITQIMTSFRNLARDYTGSLSYNTVLTELGCVECNRNAENILDVLLKYSLIVPKDQNGRLFFNYREKQTIDTLNKEKCTYILHKALYLHFK